MKIAILGAAGAMARVVLRDLLEFVPDVEITAADLKPISHDDSRVRSATMDARDEAATARLLEGHDAVLNCVTYYFNVPIMRAALNGPRPLLRPRRPVPRLDQAVRPPRGLRAGGGAGPARHGIDARHHQRHGRRPRTRPRFRRGGARPRRLHRPRRLGPAAGPVRPRHGHRRVLARADGLPRRSGRRDAADERPGIDRVSGSRRARRGPLHAALRGRHVPPLVPRPARGELQGRLRARVHGKGPLPRRARVRLAREDRRQALAPRGPPGSRGPADRRLPASPTTATHCAWTSPGRKTAAPSRAAPR